MVVQGDEVTLPSSNSVTLQTLQKGDGVTRFLRFSKPNFVRKTMCETIEKITLLSVYFYSILWIKKIFEGDLVSLKNAITQQTRAAGQFKNFEAP